MKYEWILEIKYLKKSEQDKLGRVKAEGMKQLERYSRSRDFKDREHLKQALVIFIGKDEFIVC